MSLLNALANIISHYKDAQASYFALYTVLNIVYSINLNPPTVQGQATQPPSLTIKGPIDLSQLKLKEDIDYQMLTFCLLRSRILYLTLI